MRTVDIIVKKRDGKTISGEEMRWLIKAYTSGEVPDYQMAAWCMAAWLNGLGEAEAVDLTLAMVESGEQANLSGITGFKLDKHSTGGVADTTTLVLGPLVAACGGKVAKMSGRGLGHTGGTLDKLESIPGFKTELSPGEFVRQVDSIGIAVIGQSAKLVPADKKLYALRDATGTVENMGLIAASIMSKKLASGADGILLDVKTGRGAFMREYTDSRALASLMVSIGKAAGRRMEAAVTDMDSPLGSAVGNALEVVEAIETLSGRGPERLTSLCVVLGGRMLAMAGLVDSPTLGEAMVRAALDDGRGLEVFRRMVAAQGGDPRVVDDTALLPRARYQSEVLADRSGYVMSLDSLAIGEASVLLGAGRARREDSVDPAVGIVIRCHPGEPVHTGEPLAVVHANSPDSLFACERTIKSAFSVSEFRPTSRPPLVYEFIS